MAESQQALEKPGYGRRSGWILILTLIMLGRPAGSDPAALQAQDTQVAATVSADVVGINDQFQLTITVSGSNSGDAEAPRLNRLKNFQVVSGPSVSTQFQWINGRTSNSKSFIYILVAEKEGDFTIEAIDVRVAGAVLRTQPINVRVTRSSSTQQPRPRQRPFDPFDEGLFGSRQRISGDEVLILAELDRGSAYQGQQVTLTYHLFTQVSVTGIQIQEAPALNGFWVEDIEVPSNPTGTRRTIDGREYLGFLIKKQALFPNGPGALKIPSATFAISGGGILGSFGQSETIYRKTQELTLESKPLPAEGRPADYKNAVGSFNLTSSLDKSGAATGEAVTLRIRLEGRGNLKIIPDLALPPLPDFTIYSSKRTESIRPFEGDTIGGERSLEYVLVPKAPGRQTVPSLSLSFFDPEKHSYGTARTQPIELDVSRGGGSTDTGSDLAGIGKQNLTRLGSDINFIKLDAAGLGAAARPAFTRLWFYLIAVLPLAVNIAILLYQREQAKESGDIPLARRRRARGVALAALRNAEKHSRQDPRQFYDQAATALGGYLADRYNLPEIAVASDSLQRTLASQAVSETTTGEVLACLQECDFGRFVDASANAESRLQLAGRIRKAIDALERG